MLPDVNDRGYMFKGIEFNYRAVGFLLLRWGNIPVHSSLYNDGPPEFEGCISGTLLYKFERLTLVP